MAITLISIGKTSLTVRYAALAAEDAKKTTHHSAVCVVALYGPWQTCFDRWRRDGTWDRLLAHAHSGVHEY